LAHIDKAVTKFTLFSTASFMSYLLIARPIQRYFTYRSDSSKKYLLVQFWMMLMLNCFFDLLSYTTEHCCYYQNNCFFGLSTYPTATTCDSRAEYVDLRQPATGRYYEPV